MATNDRHRANRCNTLLRIAANNSVNVTELNRCCGDLSGTAHFPSALTVISVERMMANNEINHAMRRLSNRYDDANEGLDDFYRRQMKGEDADAAEFFALVQKRATSQEAMEAQFKLQEKPLKTVLSESH